VAVAAVATVLVLLLMAVTWCNSTLQKTAKAVVAVVRTAAEVSAAVAVAAAAAVVRHQLQSPSKKSQNYGFSR
jgi:cytoskeletal protein RodZ